MTAALIQAAAEGRREDVLQILSETPSTDVNGKDEQGATALVEAVKNGHVEVVRVLLDKGADPTLPSSSGSPQECTQDPAILELVNSALSKTDQNGYVQDPNANPEKSYYPPPPPPGAYPYYPPPAMPEGTVYYPQPPEGQPPAGSGPGNLPPPEIARLIPCRYFPACRYGSSCMFAHPQGPYFQGPLPPPAQYPAPYDPMNPQNYSPNYYPMSPPSFQPPPPNGVPMNSLPSSTPPMTQGPPSNEMTPPPAPFSPNGAPVPLPYPTMPPMVAPSPYPPHPVPVYHQGLPPPPQGQSQSPPAMYNGAPPPAPFVMQPNVPPQYPVPVPVAYPDANGAAVKSPPLNPQSDYANPVPPPTRENATHNRRGSMRRGSFGVRPKPPCLFFPAGKCKNGDDCRFPHVLPDNPAAAANQYFSGGRGGAPRSTRHLNGDSNGVGALDQKMSAISQNGPQINGKAESQNRPRHGMGFKNGPNGAVPPNNKRSPPPKQRVPNADDFPVLAGSTTPPTKAVNGYFNGNGHTGPTAAQVLQAPPPGRRESANVTRTASPDSASSVKDSKPEVNGTTEKAVPAPTSVIPTKLPVSFAAVTANSVPEAAAEVSVSA
ncbi:protein with ankyrin repeats [Moniliophthora roreri MCA 2997]|uniref:Protein with ankyrin repeats n=1 Tax=Moniliophthora roreri (strain MCA 2997) TaxID=1381753 RepID=V2XWE2_MONRO|nr:protein with ankyrin repeats [Moniliophthora roreri MCA 2997]